jgi:hypothetical protein
MKITEKLQSVYPVSWLRFEAGTSRIQATSVMAMLIYSIKVRKKHYSCAMRLFYTAHETQAAL